MREKYPFTGHFGNTHGIPPFTEWGAGAWCFESHLTIICTGLFYSSGRILGLWQNDWNVTNDGASAILSMPMFTCLLKGFRGKRWKRAENLVRVGCWRFRQEDKSLTNIHKSFLLNQFLYLFIRHGSQNVCLRLGSNIPKRTGVSWLGREPWSIGHSSMTHRQDLYSQPSSWIFMLYFAILPGRKNCNETSSLVVERCHLLRQEACLKTHFYVSLNHAVSLVTFSSCLLLSLSYVLRYVLYFQNRSFGK